MRRELMIGWLSCALAACWLVACATGSSSPGAGKTDAAAPAEPQAGVRAPFPEAFRVSDLRAIFTSPHAPSAEALARCDFDYQVEKRIAGSVASSGPASDVASNLAKEQLFHTFPAHVLGDPDRYHWCFFGKVLAIHEKLAAPQAIWDDFIFLTHVARVFQVDLKDPRYLRWVIWTYQKVGHENFLPAVRPGSETEWQLSSPEFPGGLPEPGASNERTR